MSRAAAPQTQSLSVNGLAYDLIRKPIRSMYLHVTEPEGRVVVTAPRRLPLSTVETFVVSKASWIARKQALMIRRSQGTVGDTIPSLLALWGKPYEVTIELGAHYNVARTETALVYTVPRRSTEENRLRWLKTWLRKEAKGVIADRLPLWETRTGLQAARWSLHSMKTRWGSCHVSARSINLNAKLVHYPLECLDYVIVHELCHLIDASHGPRFQAAMDRFMPGWRSVRRRLHTLGPLD